MSQEKCIVQIVSDSYLASPFREQLTPWGNYFPWVLVSDRALTVRQGLLDSQDAPATIVDKGHFPLTISNQ